MFSINVAAMTILHGFRERQSAIGEVFKSQGSEKSQTKDMKGYSEAADSRETFGSADSLHSEEHKFMLFISEINRIIRIQSCKDVEWASWKGARLRVGEVLLTTPRRLNIHSDRAPNLPSPNISGATA